MFRFLTSLSIAGSIALAAGYALPAMAQMSNPFGPNAIALSDEEIGLIRHSLGEVLNAYEVGATSQWHSEKTGRSGVAILVETFERNGMPCAVVTHRIKSGRGYPYTAPLCKVEEKGWMLAF